MKVTYADVLEMDEDELIELQDAAGYGCAKLGFEPANGDDEDEEEEEDEEKKKENDEEDEDDDDDDDGAIQRLSRQARKIEQDIAAVEEKRRRAWQTVAACIGGSR
jgi:hypothetical protein